MRRGFTILELTLATMIGAVVLATALGVFASMERGDAVLAKRAKENSGLEMASIAIERAVGTMVMETGGQSGGASAGGSTGADGTVRGSGGAPTGRARFLLETDVTAGLPGMPDVAPARDGTAGSAALVAGSFSSPQRLELVVPRHPIPLMVMPALVAPGAEPVAGDDVAAREDATGGKPVAVRGEFALCPEPVRPGAEDEGTTWTLWWRPIERRVGDTGSEAFAGVDSLAAPLATGLKSCRWSVFYEDAWETSHATAAVLDLPAYVKLQVTTATGLEADWLFEVGWSMGPEFQTASSEEDDEGSDEDELEEDQATERSGTMTDPDSSGRPQSPRTTSPSQPPRRVKPGSIKPAAPGVKKPAPPAAPGGPRQGGAR